MDGSYNVGKLFINIIPLEFVHVTDLFSRKHSLDWFLISAEHRPLYIHNEKSFSHPLLLQLSSHQHS